MLIETYVHCACLCGSVSVWRASVCVSLTRVTIFVERWCMRTITRNDMQTLANAIPPIMPVHFNETLYNICGENRRSMSYSYSTHRHENGEFELHAFAFIFFFLVTMKLFGIFVAQFCLFALPCITRILQHTRSHRFAFRLRMESCVFLFNVICVNTNENTVCAETWSEWCGSRSKKETTNWSLWFVSFCVYRIIGIQLNKTNAVHVHMEPNMSGPIRNDYTLEWIEM